MIRAISATVISSAVEMLKSSFSPASRAVAVTMPVGDVVDVGDRARLLARAEDLQRLLAGQHLLDHVGDHVRDAGLVLGHLARAVRVERAADRVAQAVLVVRRAAVDLARELREAVRRPRRRRVAQVVLGGRERASRSRTPSTSDTYDEALDVLARSPRGRSRCRGRGSSRAACTGTCGSCRCRRRSPPGGSRGRSRRIARARAVAQVARGRLAHHVGRLALVGDPHARRRRRAAAARPPSRSCRRRR